MDLSGRTVLVTGASSGLGRGIADLVAQLGGRVILVARDPVRLEATRAALAGGPHVVEAFDLSNPDGIPVWMRELATRHGVLHGLVHSAGILTTKPLRMQSASDWELAMRINVSAGAALAKGFRQRGVNVDPVGHAHVDGGGLRIISMGREHHREIEQVGAML